MINHCLLSSGDARFCFCLYFFEKGADIFESISKPGRAYHFRCVYVFVGVVRWLEDRVECEEMVRAQD